MSVIAIGAGITVACKIAMAIAAACAAAGAAAAGAKLLEDYNKSEAATEEDQKYTNGWLKSYEEKGNTPELWENIKSNLKPNHTANEREEIDSIQGNYDEGTYESHYDSTLKAKDSLTAKAGDFDFSEEETVGKLLPGNKDEEYDKGTGIGVPPVGTEETEKEVKDETDTNTGTNIIDWISWAEEDRNARWAREDAIRAETQAREDNAYQRAVADMRKAGINPNLMNVQPAASGGGITQASGQNLEGLTSQMNIDADKIMQMIDQAFEGNEADKNRFVDLFTEIIGTIGLIMAFKKGGK